MITYETNYLAHHGVKGMKWGVRKPRDGSSGYKVVKRKKDQSGFTYGAKIVTNKGNKIKYRDLRQIKKHMKQNANATYRKYKEAVRERDNLAYHVGNQYSAAGLGYLATSAALNKMSMKEAKRKMETDYMDAADRVAQILVDYGNKHIKK